jgi:hypothetical protein
MLPQDFSQGTQHVRQRRMPFMDIPWHGLRQQRWLLSRTSSIPCLHQCHQHHRQWGLPVDRLTTPTLCRLKTHMLFRLQYGFLNTPTVVIPLYDFGIRHARIGTKEKIVPLFSGRISNDDHADGHTSANVVPQTGDPQHQTLNLIALFVNGYLRPALLSIGCYFAWARQTLSLLRLSSPFAFEGMLGRQRIDGGVSAYPADQIHVGRQRLNHLTFGILSIGRDTPLHGGKGLSRGLNHLAGQFLTRAKDVFARAIRTLSVQGENRRKNPSPHSPLRQPHRNGTHHPVVCPVNDRALVRGRADRGILEPAGMSDVPAPSANRGIVDPQVGHRLACTYVLHTRFEDHRINHMSQQRDAQVVERPGCPIEEFLIDRPVPVGQTAKCSKDTRYSHRAASENPAEHDLSPGPSGRLGKDIAKLENQIVPCRYKRCSIHADFPIQCWSYNLHIGSSASLLSRLHLLILSKVHVYVLREASKQGHLDVEQDFSAV